MPNPSVNCIFPSNANLSSANAINFKIMVLMAIKRDRHACRIIEQLKC